MKSILLGSILSWVSSFAIAQQGDFTKSNNYVDVINTDQINEVNVFASDTFNQIVQKIITQKNISIPNKGRYSKAYFINKTRDRYLKIWGGPDLGYGWFFTIGYLKEGKCTDCGSFLKSDTITNYVVNNGIKLGDNIKQVWDLAHLNYYRKFTFQGITYYYFEKGIKQEVPFAPDRLFYYKFDANGKLIEIGFGYGMIGENPMLRN